MSIEDINSGSWYCVKSKVKNRSYYGTFCVTISNNYQAEFRPQRLLPRLTEIDFQVLYQSFSKCIDLAWKKWLDDILKAGRFAFSCSSLYHFHQKPQVFFQSSFRKILFREKRYLHDHQSYPLM